MQVEIDLQEARRQPGEREPLDAGEHLLLDRRRAGEVLAVQVQVVEVTARGRRVGSVFRQVRGQDAVHLVARQEVRERRPWKRPLEELLEDLVDLWLPQAEQKKINLQYLPEQGTTPVKVHGDALLLQRLFANLIENALNYTPSGGQVTLSLSQKEDWIWVTVQDTGIGIAPEHLPHVFDRLWRADQARTRWSGGSGLGLAIAKNIVEQHHGQMIVTSQVGVGSCFQVIFKLFSSPITR